MTNCNNCGRKLSLIVILTRDKTCNDCKNTFKSELKDIKQDILSKNILSEENLQKLKKYDKRSLINLYNDVYDQLFNDKELDENEISILNKIQEGSNLTNDDVTYNDRVRPYIYALMIKKEGKLPSVQLEIKGTQVILKKGEIVHFVDNAKLMELKSINLGYKGSSKGVSIRICKGVSYRVGSNKGHIVKQDKYVEVSRGFILITNQRIFLQPITGKPMSIPLDKVLSYRCYNNGVDLYKEGREKGYFVSMNSGSSEIFGMCISHLLDIN